MRISEKKVRWLHTQREREREREREKVNLRKKIRLKRLILSKYFSNSKVQVSEILSARAPTATGYQSVISCLTY
jgi:hypothetical protein